MTAQYEHAPILNQIHRAERRHGPIKDLRQEQARQVADQIARESKVGDAITDHLRKLDGALEGLAKIWAEDDTGRELVQKQIASITRAYFTICLLRSALSDGAK